MVLPLVSAYQRRQNGIQLKRVNLFGREAYVEAGTQSAYRKHFTLGHGVDSPIPKETMTGRAYDLAEHWKTAKKEFMVAKDGKWVGGYVGDPPYARTFSPQVFNTLILAVNYVEEKARDDRDLGFKTEYKVFETVGSWPEHRRVVYHIPKGAKYASDMRTKGGIRISYKHLPEELFGYAGDQAKDRAGSEDFMNLVGVQVDYPNQAVIFPTRRGKDEFERILEEKRADMLWEVKRGERRDFDRGYLESLQVYGSKSHTAQANSRGRASRNGRKEYAIWGTRGGEEKIVRVNGRETQDSLSEAQRIKSILEKRGEYENVRIQVIDLTNFDMKSTFAGTIAHSNGRSRFHTPEKVYGEGPFTVLYSIDFGKATMLAYDIEAKRVPAEVDLGNYQHVGSINAIDLEDVYMKMQGEMWSPRGEARDYIRSLKAKHTSMSMGDLILYKGNYHMVMRMGFKKVKWTGLSYR